VLPVRPGGTYARDMPQQGMHAHSVPRVCLVVWGSAGGVETCYCTLANINGELLESCFKSISLKGLFNGSQLLQWVAESWHDSAGGCRQPPTGKVMMTFGRGEGGFGGVGQGA